MIRLPLAVLAAVGTAGPVIRRAEPGSCRARPGRDGPAARRGGRGRLPAHQDGGGRPGRVPREDRRGDVRGDHRRRDDGACRRPAGPVPGAAAEGPVGAAGRRRAGGLPAPHPPAGGLPPRGDRAGRRARRLGLPVPARLPAVLPGRAVGGGAAPPGPLGRRRRRGDAGVPEPADLVRGRAVGLQRGAVPPMVRPEPGDRRDPAQHRARLRRDHPGRSRRSSTRTPSTTR